jgi:hypothetical protein
MEIDMPPRWFSRERIVIIVLALLTAALYGVIGNGVYALVVWLWNQVPGYAHANTSLSIVFPLWILSGFVIVAWFIDRTNLRHGINTLSHAIKHVNTLDTYLVSSAPQLLSSKKPECDLECEVHNIVRRLLKQAIEAFPRDVHRAILFLPDPRFNGEYLTVWEDYGGIDKDSKERKKFYIGIERPDLKKGVAGEAFHERKLIVTHIIEQNSRWHPDRESYICFDSENTLGSMNSHPPYTSFVCVPLIVQKGDKECLGVVCFDSKNSKVFDPREVTSLLFLLAARIRAIIVIYQEVQAFFSK